MSSRKDRPVRGPGLQRITASLSWQPLTLNNVAYRRVKGASRAVPALVRLRLLERRQILDQINQVLRGHRFLEIRRHQRSLELSAAGNVGFFDVTGYRFGVFDDQFILGVAFHDADQVVARFQRDLPGLVTNFNARAGIENRLVKGVLAEFCADLRKRRADVRALVIDAMAGDANHLGPCQNPRPARHIAAHSQ